MKIFQQKTTITGIFKTHSMASMEEWRGQKEGIRKWKIQK